MKHAAFEIRLIAAAPINGPVDRQFTDRVMRKIHIIQIATEPVHSAEQPRGSFMAWLHHAPKFAVIALALAALVVLGGTSYALYKAFWSQPHVSVTAPTTNQYGRTQVAASLKNCGNQSAAVTFEIKTGSTLDPSEIGKILQARCELTAVNDWSNANQGQSNAAKKPTEGTSQSSMIMVSPVASKVASINDTSLSLTGGPTTPATPLTLTDQTQYIVNNEPSTRDQIHPGDTVLYIQDLTMKNVTTKSGTSYNTSGTPIARKTTYVIKVDLPYEYYGPSKQNQIAQRQACIGNPQDSCVQMATVDLYNSSSADALNPGNEMRSIQGIVTEYSGNTIKIQSSSDRIFTLTTPSDIVTNFNQNKSANYNGTKVAVGDLLQVSYVIDKNDSGLALGEPQIISIQLALNLIQKSDPVQKY